MKTLFSANPQESSGWKPVTGCDRGDPLAEAAPPHEASQPAVPSSSKPEGPPAHTNQKRFTCPQVHCAKTFSSKYKLCRHVATHSLQKSHQCIHCGKMFHRKDHLKNHLQTHNPNKEALQCPECSKHYSTKHGHRRHLALHAAASGDLSCKLCLQVFTDSQAVLEHLKSHSRRTSGGSKEKKYSCEHCDRCFYTRKDVRRHLVVHTGRKDFQCHFCLQRFGRKDHLTRHLKKSHFEEMPHIKSEPPDTLSHMSYGSAIVKEELAPFMCLQPRDLMPTGMYSTPFQTGPDSGFSHSLGPNNPTNSTASFSVAPSSRPTARFPLTTTSYLPKNEMDGFFSEASGCLSLSSSEVSSSVSQPIAEESFFPALCDPLSATGVDFNHFLGFLPLNACNIPVSTSSTIMGFPQAEVQPLPLTLNHSQALGFSGTVTPCPPPVCTSEYTASALPRFHQAFK